MTETATDRPTSPSVVFADSDYVGLFRRFVIVAVDGLVVGLMWPLLAWLWYRVIEPVGEPYDQLMWSWIGFIYLYLAILKSTRVRTLGLWITGSRVVDHRGKAPSFVRMTFRLLLWLLGPVNPIVDLFWLSSDRHRQTVRDKFAGTYVVRRYAVPVGQGKRKAAYYNLMGATVIFWEIQPEE